MDYPSGLGRNPVQNLALNVYVLSHHTLPRVSFHLKTRQEYFFYDEESFGMLKTGFGGTWYSTFFGNLFADAFFLSEMGQNGVSGQLLLRFAPFLLQ
jgi:hypothetical protein